MDQVPPNGQQLMSQLCSTHKASCDKYRGAYLIQKNFAPTADGMDSSVPTLDIYLLRAITQLRHPDISFTEEDFSTEKSKATTPEEQALGHFTGRKLKTMDTWIKWEFGERRQLN